MLDTRELVAIVPLAPPRRTIVTKLATLEPDDIATPTQVRMSLFGTCSGLALLLAVFDGLQAYSECNVDQRVCQRLYDWIKLNANQPNMRTSTTTQPARCASSDWKKLSAVE